MPDAAPGAKFAPSYDTTTVPGVVIDNVTGLMWQRMLPDDPASPELWYEGCTGMRSVMGDRCTWPQARRYCSALTLANKEDWRLPSKIELQSILDETSLTTADSLIGRTVFPNTPPEPFWSSSPHPTAAHEAWPVDFSNGSSVTPMDESEPLAVRCVRGSATGASTPKDRYFIEADGGLVTDRRTGLTWQRTVSTTRYNWENAKVHCTGLGGGFRLPALKELLTLVDPTRHEPATDPTTFPGQSDYVLWSSSPFPAIQPVSNLPTAWLVTFDDGAPSIRVRNEGWQVRCVR
jgi:hypothetical protein